MDSNHSKDEQENECLALKSIYGDEMVELVPKSKPDNDWAPLEYFITVKTLRSGPPHPDPPIVCLHVTCTHDYPQKIPDIKLENWKRISNKDVDVLLSELKNIALKMKGKVMIFELVQHIENFLHDYDLPGTCSFYDEMMTRQKNKEEQERLIKEAEDEKKKKEVRALIQVKEQAVKKALRRRQNSVKSLEGDFDTLVPSTPPEKPGVFQDFKAKKKNEDDNPWALCEKGQSRFAHEFEHIGSLGQGAFGHVIKVRNKLDDGLYAIKRIVLDPMEKQLNKKITREVKLLSRLNHENVVRYYNSWIESSEADMGNVCFPEEDYCEMELSKKKLTDEILDMLPHNERSLNWDDDAASSSDENSEDFIMFRSGSNGKNEEGTNKSEKSASEVLQSCSTIEGHSISSHHQTLTLYIQMELCDKSTLRLAIDDDLYLDMNRVWRLFREVVEGLCHIHQQGIIHRDLKPVNIFIGHDDHVKIGDFGLATTILLQKQTVKDTAVIAPPPEILTPHTSTTTTDTSQTGHVGTTLYVAPELNIISVKFSYNQKVDIYSLGIIFFEMCSAPMATTMERIKILSDLRQQEPVFPEGYYLDEISPQRRLMRSMLQYDLEKRPSAQDLLQNSSIPPPKREESEVSLMIKRTLSNPQSRSYKFLIASCFEQAVQPSLDATYNVSSWRSTAFLSSLEVVSDKLRNIFHNHAAYSFLPPLLTPAGQVLESTVCLMTRFGSVVCATHDLLMPFARYLAQNPSVTQLKRYALDKVYRERPAGVHPKENYACAFDIVTPSTGDLLPEYEILSVIMQILREFPSVLSRNCVIYLNHSKIISVMMSIAGLDARKFEDKCIAFFQKNFFFQTKNNLELYLKSLNLPEKSITTLIQWLGTEGSLNTVNQIIASLLKDNQHLATIKIAFLELETIINFIQMTGFPCPVMVNLGHVRNAHYYSGIMFQIACCQKNRPKQNEKSVILSGGRYDNLVHNLRDSLSRDDGKVNQHVVGFTLSVDKFIFSTNDNERLTKIDVLVCAIGKISASHEKLFLLNDLWKSGLKSSFCITVETVEEIQSRCKDLSIPALVLLKESDSGFARIRTLVKDRYNEKKVNYSDILDFLWKHKASLLEVSYSSAKPEIKPQQSPDTPVISFITLEKLTTVHKRRYESQILNNVQNLLLKFSVNVRIEILALPLNSEIIRDLSHCTDPNCYELELKPVLHKYPKYKKIIRKFQDYMDGTKNSNVSTVFILYSLNDNTHSVII